jgi:uncharacterized protein YkwD
MLGSLLLAGLVWAAGNTAPLSPVALPAPVLPAPIVRVAAVRPAPRVLQVSLADTAAMQEAAFVTLINAERAERGLSTLTLDPMLTQTARAHSAEMCSADYFDHHSPTPGLSSPMDRYLSSSRQLGLPQPEYLLVGENIYYCSVCNDIYNVDYAHRALMASPGHRANILEPRFAKIGVGVYRNAGGEFWVTEMFSRDRQP